MRRGRLEGKTDPRGKKNSCKKHGDSEKGTTRLIWADCVAEVGKQSAQDLIKGAPKVMQSLM